MKRTTCVIGALLIVMVAVAVAPARAAQITEVQDSFEEGHPFGMALHVRYQYINDTSMVLRENIDQVKNERYLLNNAIEVNRFRHIMHFDLAVGLYHDLELALNLPVILVDQSSLDIDTNVVKWAPASFRGNKRTGLGNMGLGIRWAPWSYTRDKRYPTWLLGIMFRIPTAQVATASNTAVGDGVFRIDVNTSISRRVFWWMEPYFDLHGSLVGTTTKKSPFADQGVEDVQTLVTPGHSIGLKLGTEFIPWEVESEGRHFSIDLGFGLDYVFEGREYTEVFELLGSHAANCGGDVDCSPFTYARSPKGIYDRAVRQHNSGEITSDDLSAIDQALPKNIAAGDYPVTNGVTDVEQYGVYTGWLGFHLQPIRYFAFGTNFSIAYRQPHFITFADPGLDSAVDGDGVVTGYNPQGENEYNPVYLEEVDKPGYRMKVDQPLTWSLLFTLTGQF